jgi:hypothetical protein
MKRDRLAKSVLTIYGLNSLVRRQGWKVELKTNLIPLCLETIKREEGKGKLGFKKDGVYDYYIGSSFRIENGAGEEKKKRSWGNFQNAKTRLRVSDGLTSVHIKV